MTSPLKNPLFRLARTAVVTLAVGYLGFAVLLYFRQAELIFPGSRTQGKPEAEFTVPVGAELVYLSTRRGERIAALWAPALAVGGEVQDSRATLLLFYGNGMCLADSLEMVSELRKLGANVLAVEYTGYGLSEGHPSENGFYATADAAYSYLTRDKQIDPSRVVVVGRSLGGAVAVDLASRRAVGGVITLSTFTSIADVAAPQFPHFPVRALLRHRFESRTKIRQVRSPVLLIHGTEDEMVPLRMRNELADAAGGPVTRYNVEGAGHNNLFERDGEGVLRAIDAFLRQLAAAASR